MLIPPRQGWPLWETPGVAVEVNEDPEHDNVPTMAVFNVAPTVFLYNVGTGS